MSCQPKFHLILGAMMLALVACAFTSCDPSSRKTVEIPAPTPAYSPLVLQAASALPANEALLLLRQHDPRFENPPLRSAAVELLAATPWQSCEVSLETHMNVDHLWIGDQSIWAALSDDRGSTAIRLDPQSGTVAATLFPTPGDPIRSWNFSPDGSRVVIERNHTSLLCDARSLLPICTLSPPPADLIPAAAVSFSADSLLFAHAVDGKDAIHWTIRDAKHGEIIRDYPAPKTSPTPIAGNMLREGLDLIHSDGKLLHLPLNPVSPTQMLRHHDFGHLITACGVPMGGFIALTRDSPHSPPITTRINPRHSPARSAAQAHDWISTDPWTLHPSVWQSGYSAFSPAACKIPKQTTAYAANLTHSIRATSDGTILIFRKLPPLCETTTLHEPCVDWPSLEPLDLWKAFPELHFDQWISPGVILPQREWPDHILAPLSQRMDQAFSPSPLTEVETIFDKADDEEVLSAIESAAPSGPGAAACLRASLLSIRPQWISACLKSYPDMPETLQKMARTRVAWLEDRKAAAIAAWPDPFPHYDHIRASEDWNHWETSDFRVPFEQIRQSVAEVLTSHRVPDDATQQQLDAVFARLTGDEALQSLGKERYAAYCLDAAMAFAQTPSEAGRVQILSQLARTMGAPLAPCLRADALALTAQENYIAARDRWISLITHFPVSAHRAGDYSEAAYCAFENHDSRQAMALLATGTHRFPNDSSFALRAGWIALLTGHYESAWRFLGKGQQIGYEPEKMPHALAMLAIASFHSGAPDESAAYHTELLRIDPTWTHSETIESLGWPEEFTSTLLQLAESLPLTPDR